MNVAVEVTEQVLARQAVEWVEEQLRLAIDSADLATWHIDAYTGAFFSSAKLKDLFMDDGSATFEKEQTSQLAE
jgi:PAS domain-containing protein